MKVLELEQEITSLRDKLRKNQANAERITIEGRQGN